MTTLCFSILLVVAAFHHKAAALFVPNITSAALDAVAASSNGAQKAYVDVAQIRNAELKFFNNGTYSFEVEMPCGVLNNRVLAVEQLSRLKLVDPAAAAIGNQQQQRTGGNFRQREILLYSLPAAAAVGAASASFQLDRDMKKQQQQQLRERLLVQQQDINIKPGREQLPARFIESSPVVVQHQPVTPNVPINPLLPLKNRLTGQDEESAAHSAQRCKCSCKDEESGQVMDNVKITVAFPKPQQAHRIDLTVVSTTASPVAVEQQKLLLQQQRRFVEVAQRRKRHVVAANRESRANQMCLYVEEGKWPKSQDGFIKSLAPSRQSPALAADAQLQQCGLHFSGSQQDQPQGRKSESFTIECRGTAQCEQGVIEPICLGGGHSVSTFNVANGELVLSIVPQ